MRKKRGYGGGVGGGSGGGGGGIGVVVGGCRKDKEAVVRGSEVGRQVIDKVFMGGRGGGGITQMTKVYGS